MQLLFLYIYGYGDISFMSYKNYYGSILYLLNVAYFGVAVKDSDCVMPRSQMKTTPGSDSTVLDSGPLSSPEDSLRFSTFLQAFYELQQSFHSLSVSFHH